MASWKKFIIIFLLILAAAATVLLIAGTIRQKKETSDMLERLSCSPVRDSTGLVDFSSLAGLPEPVQKYFRTVLREGQPLISRTLLNQSGELRINRETDKWSRFKAEQTVCALRPGFIWNAKISIAPLMHVRVMDSYIKGSGSGKVSLMSLLTVALEEDRPELNSGALYRYLAEAVWYPTALLPGSGIKWRAIDSRRATATLTDKGISVSLEFRFSDSGEVAAIYTEDRYGQFDGSYKKYPWEGHFSKYETRNGIRIPMEAEVGWHLPEGWWLFWKGRIKAADYEF